jgi:hypothetical protein
MDGLWLGDGDILVKDGLGIEWPFATECKCIERSGGGKDQPTWDLGGMFTATKEWTPWEWWFQAKKQAVRSDKLPLLIFSKNRFPILFMLPESICKILRPIPNRSPFIRVLREDGESVTVGLLSDLTSTVPFKRLNGLRRDWLALSAKIAS